MKALMTICAISVLALAASQVGAATDFYAITNELGYQGTIWNITDNTGPWATSTPRNANLYTTMNAPATVEPTGNYNELLSSWWEHSPSNQNDSFLQMYEEKTTPSITSASGGWDATKKIYTVAVEFTATFSQAAAIDSDGWMSNTVMPDTIVGSFTGKFVVTYDVAKNPITDGDTYGFDIDFSKALFTTDGGAYGAITPFSSFSEVPEPATLGLLGMGALSLLRRKK